jgi:hypothetical protein
MRFAITISGDIDSDDDERAAIVLDHLAVRAAVQVEDPDDDVYNDAGWARGVALPTIANLHIDLTTDEDPRLQ